MITVRYASRPNQSEFALPQRLLMGPGPSNVSPRVLRAMATPLVDHLDPEFLALMDQTQQLLRWVFQTQNQHTLPVSGSESAGMEACLVNLIEPGDRMLVCVCGEFGQRMAEGAQRAGAAVTTIERPWGQVFPPDEIADATRRVSPKVVGIVHAETSTGAWQPIEDLGDIAHEAEALLLVDCVTSLGGVPVLLDEWGVDAAFSGTQKCLSSPPGLAPVSFSPRAIDTIKSRKTKVGSWYFDMSMIERSWGQERSYHHTVPITMIYALHEALRLIAEEGLQTRWARHQRHHLALAAGLAAMGITYVNSEGDRLPPLSAVYIPEGIDDMAVRQQLMSEFGIEIGGGLGAFKGHVWRIGLMGHTCRAENVLSFLAALETCLTSQGAQVPPGAGVAGAIRTYNESPAPARAG